jgi:hypothetical protein
MPIASFVLPGAAAAVAVVVGLRAKVAVDVVSGHHHTW